MTPQKEFYVERPCRVCSRPVMARPDDFHPRCLDCGMTAHMSAATQSRVREGPVYERIARGQYKHWRSEVERLGILPDG